MSLYRFARMSALLALAGKYRHKLFNMGAAAAFALVTAWLYDDIAEYLGLHYPGWIGFALVVKTLVVYAALFFLLWQLRPERGLEVSGEGESRPSTRPGVSDGNSSSKLDQIARKPHLTSRKEAMLKKP